MSDIVEELRLLQSGAQWACGQTAATLEQAADEIERLRAERDRLRAERDAHRDAHAAAQNVLDALYGERDRLREALQDMLADREAWQIGRDTRDRARAALKETGHE
jgi:chromosome segregation ATPase